MKNHFGLNRGIYLKIFSGARAGENPNCAAGFFYLPARIPRGFAPGMNGGETNFSDRVAKRSAGIRRGSARRSLLQRRIKRPEFDIFCHGKKYQNFSCWKFKTPEKIRGWFFCRDLVISRYGNAGN